MSEFNQGLVRLQEFLQLKATLTVGQDIQRATQELQNEIRDFRSEFNWAMGDLALRVNLQTDVLKALLETIHAPLDTQAKELRKRAEYSYSQGWYPEALGDLLESEKKNYQDFSIYAMAANIFLFHQEPPNLDKAREYYLKLARFATPVSSRLQALGFMYAAFVCYLQQDDAAAIEIASKAIQADESLTEAYYNLAKFAAAAGNLDLSLPNLETAIRRDPDYLEKAKEDPDFSKPNSVNRFTDFITKLMQEAEKSATSFLQSEKRKIASYQFSNEAVATRAHELIANAENLIGNHSYGDYIFATKLINRASKLNEPKTITLVRHYTGEYSLDSSNFDVLVDGQEDDQIRKKNEYMRWKNEVDGILKQKEERIVSAELRALGIDHARNVDHPRRGPVPDPTSDEISANPGHHTLKITSWRGDSKLIEFELEDNIQIDFELRQGVSIISTNFGELDPKVAIDYFNRALGYSKKGNFDQAIADYTKAIVLDPRYANAYCNRGLNYYRKDKFDQAIADYTMAIELDSTDSWAYNRRGLACIKKGNFDQAIADYTKAIELDPKNASAYYNRGSAHYDKGNFDQAIVEYTQAIELDPKYVNAQFNRGLAYRKKGLKPQAIADFEMYLKLASAASDRAQVEQWIRELKGQ